MKLQSIFTVLFLCSLLLLLPLTSPPVEQTLFPFEEQNIVFNVKSPTVEILADIDLEILVNISYYNPSLDAVVSYLNTSLFSETTVNLGDPGIYVFSFFSIIIAEVEIHQIGLPIASIGIMVGLGIVNLALVVYSRYNVTVTY